MNGKIKTKTKAKIVRIYHQSLVVDGSDNGASDIRHGWWHRLRRLRYRPYITSRFDDPAPVCLFRAFTSAAVALANGASKIVMVCTVKEALELRQAGIDEICFARRARLATP
jgi:hypothetical protein